jgi:hypothetical protein
VSQRLLIRVAALNNAEWCDAFCRTHGIVGHFRAGYWFSPVRTPRYYPDAVTLLPEITLEQVLSVRRRECAGETEHALNAPRWQAEWGGA